MGYFLGYPRDTTGYRVLLDNGRVVESSDVLFYDSTVLQTDSHLFADSSLKKKSLISLVPDPPVVPPGVPPDNPVQPQSAFPTPISDPAPTILETSQNDQDDPAQEESDQESVGGEDEDCAQEDNNYMEKTHSDTQQVQTPLTKETGSKPGIIKNSEEDNQHHQNLTYSPFQEDQQSVTYQEQKDSPFPSIHQPESQIHLNPDPSPPQEDHQAESPQIHSYSPVQEAPHSENLFSQTSNQFQEDPQSAENNYQSHSPATHIIQTRSKTKSQLESIQAEINRIKQEMLEKEIQDRLTRSTRYNLRKRTTGLSAIASNVESEAKGSVSTELTTQIPSPNLSPSSQAVDQPRQERNRTDSSENQVEIV
jgi:hypothetical protein